MGSERYVGTVGPYGLHESNERGLRLIELCEREVKKGSSHRDTCLLLQR